MKRNLDSFLEKIGKGIKKSAITGIVGLAIAYGAGNTKEVLAQTYDFDNPGTYAKLMTTADAIAEYGSQVDDVQYQVGTENFVYPVAQDINHPGINQNLILHGSPFSAELIYSLCSSETTQILGAEYTTDEIRIDISPGEYSFQSSAPKIERPTQINGTVNVGSLESTLYANNGIRIIGNDAHLEINSLILAGDLGNPTYGSSLAFTSGTSGIVSNSLIYTPMRYDNGDSLDVTNSTFNVPDTAIYVYGLPTKIANQTIFRNNVFNEGEISFSVQFAGVDAGASLEGGNNSFIGVDTPVYVQEGSTIQSFRGNFWAAPSLTKSGKAGFEVLTNPSEILARQTINLGTGIIDVGDALSSDPNEVIVDENWPPVPIGAPLATPLGLGALGLGIGIAGIYKLSRKKDSDDDSTKNHFD